MRRKNLIVKRKAKKYKFFIKDLKVNEFYKRFEKVIFNNIKKEDFAVAVSGGPDSLCLAYFAKIYKNKNKSKVIFFDR